MEDNPALWSQIEAVRTSLGVGGMSSDETDTEWPKRNKHVRRVTLPWRDPALVQLWKAVESYGDKYPLTIDTRGNKSFPRLHAPSDTPSKRTIVRRLPANFYDPNCIKLLTPRQRNQVGRKSHMQVPELVSNTV